MTLDPQVQAMRARLVAAGDRPLYEMTLAEARAADLAAIRRAGGTPEPVARVDHRHVDGPAGPVPIRLYRPGSGSEVPGPLPVLVYFFGGGWTLGSLDTCDAICRRLANATPCLVVSVGYRLAPEHPFPAGLQDCYHAVREIAGLVADHGGDPDRIAVGGDSAGGNLAAAVSLMVRDRGGPGLCGQLLVYPNTDQLGESPSLRDNDDPVFFNHRSVAWYRRHYLPDHAAAADPYASPLRAADLAGLPPALVLTAEYDPLRDEGERYARRLAEDGTPATLHRYDGMIHGFFAMAGELDAGARAQDRAAGFLRERFAVSAVPR